MHICTKMRPELGEIAKKLWLPIDHCLAFLWQLSFVRDSVCFILGEVIKGGGGGVCLYRGIQGGWYSPR